LDIWDKMSKLFLVVNVDWFFLSHRLPIALAAQKAGYEVTVIARDTGRRREIESHQLQFIDIPFDRSGSNPMHEIRCVLSLIGIYKKNKPDIIHHVTLKAVLLGCIAAKLAGCRRVVNAISGFGYNFTAGRDGIKQKTVRNVMKLAFQSKHFHFIFQNPDDVRQFSGFQFVPEKNIHLIKGSGVDLNQFTYEKEIPKEKVRFILPARMLLDKGIVEFINAAKSIKEQVVCKAEFILAGDCDPINLAGISEDELKAMIDPPYIQWIGFQKEMFHIYKESDVVVLPSYREGLPKSLIEACAAGRPVITTDTQGCRECVVNGYNGYLVPVKNTQKLAQYMELLTNDKEKREQMGKNGRLLAEQEFSIDKVIESHLSIYNTILNS